MSKKLKRYEVRIRQPEFPDSMVRVVIASSKCGAVIKIVRRYSVDEVLGVRRLKG